MKVMKFIKKLNKGLLCIQKKIHTCVHDVYILHHKNPDRRFVFFVFPHGPTVETRVSTAQTQTAGPHVVE